MHLKSLRIQGFKTFARRTELPFSRGITAIVGPNGSGKSNLVDAIRWALGERNARGLRGHRMEDVIYSGGPGKSAVGMAEVTLTIDNADQRLNVEFTEVEVARRLFRSGESEYLINGSRARLKDIDSLLASTGLRQDGYAVTAQNDIDYVIQAAPGLRRELIEEAAGVRRLRDQRQEAVNRLAEADRDMRRARDILNELSPRADELKTQAEAAVDYQRVAEQLKSLQGSLARDAWRKAMVHLRRATIRLNAAQQKRAAAAEAVSAFEPLYAEHRAALLAAREARWRHQEAVAELRLQLAESQHQARIAQQRADAARQALATAQHEMARLSESAQAGGRVVEELDRAVQSTQAEIATMAASVQAAVATEQEQRSALAQLEGERSGRQQHRQELHRERVAIEAELRQLEGRLQFLTEQRQQARAQLEAWSDRHGAVMEQLRRRTAEADAAEVALYDLNATASEVEHQTSLAEKAMQAAERALADTTSRVRTLEAEVGALYLLRDRAQQQSALQGSPGWQRLVEMLDVAEGDRPAVEAALEGWLHAWVPADRAAAELAIDLVTGAETRETVLREPAAAASPAALPPGARRVADLIQAAALLRPLLDHLLGEVVVVADRAEALEVVARFPGLKAVTRSGELVSIASYRGGTFAQPLLDLQARLRAAEASLFAARDAAQQAAAELEDAIRRHGGLVEQKSTTGARVEGVRTEWAKAAGALAAAREAADREAQQEVQVRQHLGRMAALLEQAQQLHAEAAARQSAAVAAETALDSSLGDLEERLQGTTREVAAALQRRQDVEIRFALAQQRHDDLVRQLERARDVWQAHGNDLAQRQAAAAELASEPADIERQRQDWLASAERLQAELTTLDATQLPDADALSTLEAQLQADEQRNVALQVELAHGDDATAAGAMEVEVAQAEVDRCAMALREDGQAVEDEPESIADVDWQKTEREVSRLQRKLEAMGPVNLLAPQEFEEARDRCESLQLQLADLEAASAQLVELRQRLEGEIDQRFRTVFQSVAINFQEFFGELFVGGRATLRLESQADGNPLDDGVEILAQTPGKRLQPLTLLSGGERALTALAFLFALQAVNPSPFYVLDEVDAALDDANVIRFNRVLKRLAAQQQFLIVTHNHSTMAQAEVLYGVTLGEHGISRIVSVRLEQDALLTVGERTA